MANSAFNHEPSFTIPGSTTDNALIRWDGTSGGGQLNSGIIIDDSNVISGITSLTVDNININGNTLTATSGVINIIPASGSAIVLDGVINIDAGVVTAATSITSTEFVGGGVGLTALNGTQITSGTVPVAQLGSSGSRSSSTFLNGANAWAAAGAGGASVIQMNDNVNIALGTGSDSILYYDGTDTIWRPKAVGSGQMRWQDTSGTMAYFETYGSQGPDIYIYHSKGSIGSHTSGVVASGERHGRIRFGASDGTAFHVGADIIGVANQNWLPAGDNDRGTRLEFYTTADDSASLSLAMTIADDGAITKPLQPAFYAVIPSGTNTNDISGDGTARTILFDSTIFDQGGDFGANDTTFTAPVSGRYRFSVSLGEAGILSGHTDGRVTLNVENEQLRVDRHPWNGKNQGTTLGSFGINALVDMDANDTVTVIWQVGGSSRVCEIGGASAPHLAWFTGELVA